MLLHLATRRLRQVLDDALRIIYVVAHKPDPRRRVLCSTKAPRTISHFIERERRERKPECTHLRVHAAAHVFPDVLSREGRVRARAADDPRADDLAVHGVRDGDGGGLEHARMRRQDVLDLDREEVLRSENERERGHAFRERPSVPLRLG
jgi:hypothetical protein